MLTSRTDKKLSGEWQRRREEALKDSTGLSQDGMFGLTDLDITIEGLGKNDPNSYKISSAPVDGFTTAKDKAIDIRQRPEVGD
jgi:hypothetical protein